MGLSRIRETRNEDNSTSIIFTESANKRKDMAKKPLGRRWQLQQRQFFFWQKKNAINPFFDASGNENVGTTIIIGREIQCLPYAGFLKSCVMCQVLHVLCNLSPVTCQ